jgi:hypothetical protein
MEHVPVTGQRHAGLHALVQDAASRAGARTPKRIRLTGRAVVASRAGVIAIGVPLAWGLSADQLRAVVAHELALPRALMPGRLRTRLAAREQVAVRVAGREDRGEPANRRDLRRLDRTGRLYAAAERVRDAAAVAAYGGGLTAVEDAAWALFRAAAVRMGFASFVWSEVVAPAEAHSLRIADVHAGWLHRLERIGGPGVTWDPREPAERLPRAHPGLAEELRTVAEHEASADNGLHPDAVTLDVLDAQEQRSLSAEAQGSIGYERHRRWTNFVDVPVSTYLPAVERSVKRYTAAATEVLERPPADRVELATTLLGQPRGERYLATVVEYVLLQQSWRREHPAVPGVLVNGEGSTVDLTAMAGPALRNRLLDA